MIEAAACTRQGAVQPDTAGMAARRGASDRPGDLGLVEGMRVAAVFKASAPHVLPAGASLDTPAEPRL